MPENNKSEKLIQDSTRINSRFLDCNSFPTFVIGSDHTITHWNKACEKLTGLSANEVIGTRKQGSAFYLENRPVLADLLLDEVSTEEISKKFGLECKESELVTGAYEAEIFLPELGKNGKLVLATAVPLKDDQGKVIGAIETLQDISDRKNAEDALIKILEETDSKFEIRTKKLTAINVSLKKNIVERQKVEDELRMNEEKFRTVADFTYDWEYWLTPKGFYEYISPSCERITGYSQTEFLENPQLLETIVHPDDRINLTKHHHIDIFSKEVCHLDFRIIKRNGELCWISHFCQPVFDSAGNFLGRRASNRDITFRKEIEEELNAARQELEKRVEERTNELSSSNILLKSEIAKSEKAYKSLELIRFSIDHANDLLYWIDPDGKIVDVNETTCLRLGYTKDELLSMTAADIDSEYSIDDYLKIWENLRREGVWVVESFHAKKNGDTIPVEMHHNYIKYYDKEFNCIFARDVTDRKELERIVSIHDKMGSLGRVTAGIAHEIRNPLSTINVNLSNLTNLVTEKDFDANKIPLMNEIIAETKTASDKINIVVKRVMDFAKPGPQNLKLANINQCAQNAFDLSSVTMRKSGIVFNMILDENLPEIHCDSQSLEQVILNLLTNAIEELSETQGKKQIELSTLQEGQNGKKFIVIIISDSGSGVPLEMQEKIFDPFVTSKHYGSGIGLSICQRVISDHQGSLDVTTSNLGGAEFIVKLPIIIDT